MGRIKSCLAALAFAAFPVSVTACTTITPVIDEPLPQTPREAVVQAQIIAIGVAEMAIVARESGYISEERARDIGARLRETAEALQIAWLLIDTGEGQDALIIAERALVVLAPIQAYIVEATDNES